MINIPKIHFICAPKTELNSFMRVTKTLPKFNFCSKFSLTKHAIFRDFKNREFSSQVHFTRDFISLVSFSRQFIDIFAEIQCVVTFRRNDRESA